MVTNVQLSIDCKENSDSSVEKTIRQPKLEIGNDAEGFCRGRVN